MRIPRNIVPSARPLKILMRNRRDALTHPGGDTVLMENLRDGLEFLGNKVNIDLDLSFDAGAYDLVHLFNLTSPNLISTLAQDAIDQDVPFLVHALQEDWPRFLNRALATAVILEKYVSSGQRRERLASTLALLRDCPSVEMPVTTAVGKAAAILCTGKQEVESVLRDYHATRTHIIPLGAGLAVSDPNEATGAEFSEAFGLHDFVLCVGRLEPRKNQLMLLAALEEDDITVVFADGGFTYAPEYSEACRRFSRRGRTHFTGRISPRMLRSAYRAARVSCLPSWYELPGLATLEAALWSRNVVTCPWGTIVDYLGQTCLYAEPDDFLGLRSQVLKAWDTSPNFALRERIVEFTWSRTARETEALYLELLAKRIR